jgi:hypothetical protein
MTKNRYILLLIPVSIGVAYLFISLFKTLTAPDESSWKTYRNSTFGYSFKYPPQAHLSSLEGFGIPASPENEDTNVTVTGREVSFGIAVSTITDLTPDAIRRVLDNTDAPVSVNRARIAGLEGYMANFAVNADIIKSDFFFVRNHGGDVLVITIQRGSALSRAILQTLEVNS